jgi:hypothetical protein
VLGERRVVLARVIKMPAKMVAVHYGLPGNSDKATMNRSRTT